MTDVADHGACSFQVTRLGDIHTVALRGELDVACSAGIEACVEAFFVADPPAMMLDLSGLTFVDSTGLRLLLLIKERADEIGCALAVIPGPPNVQKVFELAGLAHALPWMHRDFVGAN